MYSVPLSPLVTAGDPPDEAASDERLLARCIAGDQAALRAFYQRHAREVMKTARRLGLHPDEVEDVAQEVFAIAFRELSRVRPDAPKAWLFRLTSNRVHDRHRRRRVREAFARLFGRETRGTETLTPEATLLQRDAEERVRGILARMSQRKREVFVLFEIEEIPGAEIARQLGIPVDTVWTRLHHARRDFVRLGRKLAVLDGSRRPGGQR
jgi:RNA polymerase sigma-70 factor (ECF subfamily)